MKNYLRKILNLASRCILKKLISSIYITNLLEWGCSSKYTSDLLICLARLSTFKSSNSSSTGNCDPTTPNITIAVACFLRIWIKLFNVPCLLCFSVKFIN